MKEKTLCIMLSLITLICASASTVFALTNSSVEAENTVHENIQINSAFNLNTLESKKGQADPVRYLEPVFNDFKLDKDIEYKEAVNYAGENEKLLLDVYTPAKDSKKNRPVIIWIHGGGLSWGSKDDQTSFETMYSKALAKKGYVTVNINYRLNPNAENDWNVSLKNGMEDVVSSIEWVRANSKKYGMDKNKIILAGSSIGAMMSINLAYGTYVDGWDRSCISSVVSICGSSVGFGPALKNAPPCTIIHGTADNINSFTNIELLMSQLGESNIKYDLYPFEGLNHQFTTGVEDWSVKNNPKQETIDQIEKDISQSLYNNVIKK